MNHRVWQSHSMSIYIERLQRIDKITFTSHTQQTNGKTQIQASHKQSNNSTRSRKNTQPNRDGVASHTHTNKRKANHQPEIGDLTDIKKQKTKHIR